MNNQEREEVRQEKRKIRYLIDTMKVKGCKDTRDNGKEVEGVAPASLVGSRHIGLSARVGGRA